MDDDDRRESHRAHYLTYDDLVASHPDIFADGVALHMFGMVTINYTCQD
jgi:hypothetical protein